MELSRVFIFFFCFLNTMPQLDSLTYFSQYFWFVLIFFSFYILLDNKILPVIAKIFKVRNKIKLNSKVLSENLKDSLNHEKVLMDSLKETHLIREQFTINGKNWLNSKIQDMNHNSLNVMNQKYISTVGLFLIKKNIQKTNE
jgi:hypothetical protein